MSIWNKAIVYRSKDESDWNEAQRLLTEAGVGFSPIVTEEVPVGGCGCKIDPRKYAGEEKKDVPKLIYRIEVANEDEKTAAGVLEGKVLPIRSYGLGVL